MRLVDADIVKEYPIRIHKYDKKNGSFDFVLGIEAVIEFVENLPTIDPVPQGEWGKHKVVVDGKIVEAENSFVCSHCKDIWTTTTKMKYCPSCGAIMKGE